MPVSRYCVAARVVRRFRRWKLTEPQTVFDLPGEVVSGHADRHVLRVFVGRSPRRMAAYLKREHCVRLRDRLSSWWHGHGALSLAAREAQTIAALQKLHVPTPAVLAFGEHEGRAFLLLSAVPGAIDLRQFLFRMGAALPDYRRSAVARRLGEAIARVHVAGYDAPDLLSKHVLIHPRRLTLTLIDWARTHRYSQIGVRLAARDLGRLHASLAEPLATTRDRWRSLHAYWRFRGGRRFCPFRELALAVGRAARRSLRRRSVRELRQAPTDSTRQHLRWIDSEQLCVTRSFWRTIRGEIPSWLSTSAKSRVQRERRDNVFAHERQWMMHRWPAAPAWRRWIAQMLGRRLETSLTRQAGLHFRVQRYGVAVPTVLAFGRRSDGSGFLLTQPLRNCQPWDHWLASNPVGRSRVIRHAGIVLKKLHAAGLRLGPQCDQLVVRRGQRVGLSAVPTSPMPKPAGRWPLVDLRTVVESLHLSPQDAAWLIRGYLGTKSAPHAGRELAEALRGELPLRERIRE